MKLLFGVFVLAISVCIFGYCAATLSEAPTGFDNKTNGMVDDATHAVDQAKFDEIEPDAVPSRERGHRFESNGSQVDDYEKDQQSIDEKARMIARRSPLQDEHTRTEVEHRIDVLLHQHARQFLFSHQFADRIHDLVGDDGRQAFERFVDRYWYGPNR